MQPVSYTALSNPDIRSFFEDRGQAADRPPNASESTRRTTSDETTTGLAPLMLAVRPSHPNMRRLSNYLPTGKTVLVEDRPCVEVRMGPRADGENQ